MTRSSLTILNGRGDTRLTWNPADPTECAEVRKTIADLKVQGYTFFLVDGAPADEVTAGAGTLLVRRLTADEVVASESEPRPGASPDPETDPPAKRRGRPPKAVRAVVAVRPVQGGC